MNITVTSASKPRVAEKYQREMYHPKSRLSQIRLLCDFVPVRDFFDFILLA